MPAVSSIRPSTVAWATVITILASSAPSGVLAQAAAPKPLAPLKVIDTAYMNRGAKACVDFFEFANGAWLARDTIPASYS